MAYAVQECYCSIEKVLYSLVDGEGRLWYNSLQSLVFRNKTPYNVNCQPYPTCFNCFLDQLVRFVEVEDMLVVLRFSPDAYGIL